MVTDDGVDYYYNIDTEATQWDKPVELMTPEEINSQGDYYWVPDEENVFVPCRLESSRGATGKFVHDDGSSENVKLKKCIPLQRTSLQRIVVSTACPSIFLPCLFFRQSTVG